MAASAHSGRSTSHPSAAMRWAVFITLQMHVGATEGSTEIIDALALPAILDAYAERGYHVVDLRTLIRSGGRAVPTA